MKKFFTLSLLYFLGFLTSCLCPDVEPMSDYLTIHTVRGSLFSFKENGIFPHYEAYNRNELGIGVYPDSTSERKEVVQAASVWNSAYACAQPDPMIYQNTIDSVSVITLYDFDEDHRSGSVVNDILKPMNIMGETSENIEISEMSFYDQHFKFSAVPDSDTLQFLITGRISDKGDFQVTTERVILED